MPVFMKDGKKILFIHVPKTAGTYIEQSFIGSGYRVEYRDGNTKPGSLNRLRLCSPQHMHAMQLQAYFNISKFDAIFMMVRNPFNRLKSEYCMRHASDIRTDASSFHKWVSDSFRKYNADKFIYDNHIRPQSEFYIPGCRVLRFEDGVQGQMEVLSNDLGLGLSLSSRVTMSRKENSGVSSSDVEMNERTADMVKMFYKTDFELFDYA